MWWCCGVSCWPMQRCLMSCHIYLQLSWRVCLYRDVSCHVILTVGCPGNCTFNAGVCRVMSYWLFTLSCLGGGANAGMCHVISHWLVIVLADVMIQWCVMLVHSCPVKCANTGMWHVMSDWLLTDCPDRVYLPVQGCVMACVILTLGCPDRCASAGIWMSCRGSYWLLLVMADVPLQGYVLSYHYWLEVVLAGVPMQGRVM